MKRLIVSLAILLSLMPATALAQNITAQGTITLNAGTQTAPVNGIDLRNTGTSSISFTWSSTPPVTAGICQMQQSATNAGPWTNFGSPFTVTASGGPLAAAMVVNFMRITCPTPIAGTGSVGVRYVGTMASPTAGTGSDVNITNPSLVVTQPVAANLNATVTGTVTANAGTGFGVAQGSATAGQTGSLIQCAVTTAAPAYTTGQTSPCSLDTTGGLRVSGISGGGGLGQGSTTAGQLGTLIQAAATTAAPSYATGTTNPLSMDLTGALRVNVVAGGGGGGGGTSSNFAAAFPTAGTAAGFNDGANMQGARVYDANTGAATEYVQGVVLRQSGAAGSVELGTSGAPMRIDPTGSTTQPVSGTITANAGTGNFIVTQGTGTNLHTVLDSGTVTANAGTGNFTVVQPTGSNLHVAVDSAPTTAVTGTVTANAGTGNFTVVQPTGTNLHVVVDTAPTTTVTGTITANAGTGFAGVGQGSTTAGQTGQLTMGAVTTAAPTYTTGQTSPLSLDLTGALRVNVTSGGGGGGTSSNFAAAFPAAGTAAGFSDGVNMQAGRVFDVDSGAGVQYVQGVSWRKTAAGGNVEFGTATDPVRTDPTGATAQPVTQATAANLNATVTAGTGWFLAQGSTTAGQTGSLSMCAVTTGAPAYTTAQTSPCSLDLAGNLRVALQSAVSSNLTLVNGQPVSVGIGNAGTTGTQRVVLASDQPTLNVAFPATPSVNISQFGAQNVVMAATGIPKMAMVGSNGTDAITATTDPCFGGTTIDFNFQPTSAATSIMITNTAGQTTSLCGIEVHGNTTTDEIISILSGTGTTCGTGTVLLRGSLTAGNGMRIAGGGGGWIAGFSNATVLKAGGVAHDICIRQNGANLVTVSGKYIKQ